ncbi:hypothetical protein HYH03_013375 [Edaphochlamys debaryana]|uniref:Uncharacterized protein n=1 Tax=Edaphochlamys debaryana TaxID=47281 RepID=A0A835XNC4_9CHLO|nr:hypothetical protein HYH03_013375 [Edaphochlamys debaryana]|eukprot:KAG2488072.1 hypothetical protein HYH03_013375 [Edaphochlamys debaryana]
MDLRTREAVIANVRTRRTPTTFTGKLVDSTQRNAFSFYCIMGGPMLTVVENLWFALMLSVLLGLVTVGAYKQLGRLGVLFANQISGAAARI